MGGAKSVPAHNVFLPFSRMDCRPAKNYRQPPAKLAETRKKTFQRRRIFALSVGQAAGPGAPCKKLPEERHKHMAKASGSLDFRGLRGAAPGSKDFASRAEAVRAPSKNGQFTGRSKFRDVCRHSGEVSQTAPETVCCPANASISLIFGFSARQSGRFRGASRIIANVGQAHGQSVHPPK